MYRSQVRMTVLAVLTFVALAVVPAVHAQALQARTWVSGVGNDLNLCSRTAPCKTFAAAISRTAAGGEISVLDPGDFGPVTITKSITINGDGTLAGILTPGPAASGIIVNAGLSDKVIIRNVSINGTPNGLDGVRYLAGGRLTLENVTIYGFQQSANSEGVDVSLAAFGVLIMNNVTINDCNRGVRLTSSAGPTAALRATLDNVRIANGGNAVEAVSNTVVTIKHSNLSHNSLGVVTLAATAVINVEDSVLTGNNSGVIANVPGSRIRLSDNAIVDNVNGIVIVGGAFVESAGNNRIAGNFNVTMPPNDVYDVE